MAYGGYLRVQRGGLVEGKEEARSVQHSRPLVGRRSIVIGSGDDEAVGGGCRR